MYIRSLQSSPYGSTKAKALSKPKLVNRMNHCTQDPIHNLFSSTIQLYPSTKKEKTHKCPFFLIDLINKNSLWSWVKNSPEGFNLINEAYIVKIVCEFALLFSRKRIYILEIFEIVSLYIKFERKKCSCCPD